MNDLLVGGLHSLTDLEFWLLIIAVVIFPRCLLLGLQGREASDQWQHILYAQELRSAGLSDLGRKLERFHPTAVFNYPPALQFFIERFGEKFAEKYVPAINVILLSFEGLMVIYLWSGLEFVTKPALLLSAVCWGMFPFYMMPISGALSVSGRLPGAFLSNLYFLIACSTLPIEAKCVLAVPIVLSTVLISKFSIQSIVIITLFASIYSMSLDFTIILIPATIVALLWGPSRTILAGSYSHTIFYAKILQHIHVATVVRNKSVFGAFSFGSAITYTQILKHFYHVPAIRLMCYFPVLLFVFIFLRFGLDVGRSSDYLGVEAVLASSIFSALLFSLKDLKFLGEADRYATFTSVLIAFSCLPLLVTAALGYGVVLLLITAATWIGLMIALKKKLRESAVKNDKSLSPLIEEIQLTTSGGLAISDLEVKTGEQPSLMAIPQNLCEKVAVLFPEQKIIGLSGNQSVTKETEEHARLLYGDSCYPYPLNVQEYADSMQTPILMIIEKRYLDSGYLKSNGLFDLINTYYAALDTKDVDSRYALATFVPNAEKNA